MCLTTEALMLFLAVLGADLVTETKDRITVHATDGDVHWTARDGKWCAPRHAEAVPVEPAAVF